LPPVGRYKGGVRSVPAAAADVGIREGREKTRQKVGSARGEGRLGAARNLREHSGKDKRGLQAENRGGGERILNGQKCHNSSERWMGGDGLRHPSPGTEKGPWKVGALE